MDEVATDVELEKEIWVVTEPLLADVEKITTELEVDDGRLAQIP